MSKVVILGGGISGLSVAYYLTKYCKPIANKIVLLEATERLGGWIQSKKFPDGSVYEMGPRSIRHAGETGFNMLEMVQHLDLESQIVPIKQSDAAAKSRFLLVDGKLHQLPTAAMGISSLFKKAPPFRYPLFSYVLKDLVRKRKIAADESMYDFAVRRFGQEVADLVMDPLCRGVFAGDARQISVKALLNAAFEAEQKHGSVIKGLYKNATGRAIKKEPSFILGKRATEENWAMWNCKNGLQTITDSLGKWLTEHDVQIKTSTPCKQISQTSDGIKIETTTGESLHCEHIFSAIPSFALASLVLSTHATLAKELESIPTVTVATITLEYKGSPSDLLAQQGFGFLVPSTQDPGTLGVIYDSCCFPEHDRKDAPHTRLTVMVGGSWFQQCFVNATHKSILNHCIDITRKYLEIKDLPVRHHVKINKSCIPQYLVGHSEKVNSIQSYLQENALSISLVGNSYHGVGVPDCVTTAKTKVEEFLQKRSATSS